MAAPKSAPRTTSWLTTTRAGWLLALLAFLLYLPCVYNGYSLDDNLVTQNHRLTRQGIKAIPEIFTSPYFKEQGFGSYEYRPVVLATFATEKQIFGEKPTVSHFLNILLFAGTILVLFQVLMRWLWPGQPLGAFVVCLLFLAHPLHTEAIVSIKNRDELLVLFFGLLFLDSALRLWKGESSFWRGLVLTSIYFTLALLSKRSFIPLALIVPAFVLLWEKRPTQVRFWPVVVVILVGVVMVAPLPYQISKVIVAISVLLSGYVIYIGYKEWEAAELKGEEAEMARNLWMKPSGAEKGFQLQEILLAIVAFVFGTLVMFKDVDFQFLPMAALVFWLAMRGAPWKGSTLIAFGIGVFLCYSIYEMGQPLILVFYLAGVFLINLYKKLWVVFLLTALYLFSFLFIFYDDASAIIFSCALVTVLLTSYYFWKVREMDFIKYLFILTSVVFGGIALVIPTLNEKLKFGIFFVMPFFTLLSMKMPPNKFERFFRGGRNLERNIMLVLPILGLTYMFIFLPPITREVLPLALQAEAAMLKPPLQEYMPENYPSGQVYDEYRTGNKAYPKPFGKIELVKETNRILKNVENPLLDLSGAQIVANGFSIVGYYLRLLAVPFPYSSYYGYDAIPVVDWGDWQVWLSILTLLAFAALSVWGYFRAQPVLIGTMWLISGLLAISNIPFPVAGIIGERLAYTPSVGFALLSGWGLLRLLRVDSSLPVSNIFKQRVLVLLLVFILVPYSFLTVYRTRQWGDYLTLYEADQSHFPRSSQMNALLGYAYKQKGEKEPDPAERKILFNKALACFKTAGELRLDYNEHQYQYGYMLLAMNRPAEAAKALKEAIDQGPSRSEQYFHLASAYSEMGKTEEAQKAYQECLRRDPYRSEAYANLSFIYFKENKFDSSIAVNRRAMRYLPGTVPPLINMGKIYYQLKQWDSAAVYLDIAYPVNAQDISMVNVLIELHKLLGHTEKVKFYESKMAILQKGQALSRPNTR
jgi:tetratricopeptide (TPR) repeat protein